jgi:hypothetical protein
MDKVKLDGRLPVGFCGACLKRMAGGALYQALKVSERRTIMHAYCEHREAGATVLLSPGRPLVWNIVSPIDAIEWEKHVALKVVMLRGMLPEIARDPAAALCADAHALPVPKELLN